MPSGAKTGRSDSSAKPKSDAEWINILKRELSEKEVLLSLNNDISSVRDKKEVLKKINPKLKKLFNTEDIFICVLDKSSETLEPFLRVGSKKRLKHPGYENWMNSKFPIHDGVIDTILETKKPIVLDLEEVCNWSKAPGYIKVSKAAGIEESLSKSLYNGAELLGVLTFWSERKGSFTAHHLSLIEKIADLISILVSNILANEELQQREKEKDILLTVSKELSLVKKREELLPILKRQFDRLSFYSDIVIAKVDENNETFSRFVQNEKDKRVQDSRYPEMRDSHHPFPDGVFEVALYAQKPVVFDVEALAKQPNPLPYINFIHNNGIVEMIGISLRDGYKEVGVIFLFSSQRKSFSELQFTLVQGIGNQLGTVVANILANEEIKIRENEKSILLTLSNEIAAVRNKDELFNSINYNLKELFAIKGFAIGIVNDDGQTHSPFLFDFEENIKYHPEFNEIISQKFNINDGLFEFVLNSTEAVTIIVNQLPSLPNTPAYISFWKKLGIPIVIGVPLRVGETNLGCLFFHIDPDLVRDLRKNLLKGVCAQISIALSNILANEKISRQLEEIRIYKEQLEEEKHYLQEEVSSGYTYSDIIGNGPEMQRVFHQLSQVSYADSTVLILGETGTGKELVARAIHNASPRREKLMVKVNCAALPANLIESELFGHERGSFTGAVERRIGKFELANHGTLFLDEIGEMPAELQVKLLRAIQEREIERVGGKSTIKVDVRIIAATNRDLQLEVDEGRFRRDLFYRLNVFPIVLPALRERKKDIPGLVTHFINKYSKNTGKAVKNVSGKVMKQLMAYEWPGNVRELEHLIERTLLTTTGKVIKEFHLPLNNKLEIKQALEDEYLKTFEENERDHIIRVLNKCNGKIFGPGGAAEILKLRVSTLNSKIKKLGIRKNKMYS